MNEGKKNCVICEGTGEMHVLIGEDDFEVAPCYCVEVTSDNNVRV